MKVTQLCPTLWDSMDYIVHGILQAKILEWIAFPFSRGSSQSRTQTGVSYTAGEFFTSWVTREALNTKTTRNAKSSKVVRYKIDIGKSVLFLYTNNEIPERGNKKGISFKVISKNKIDLYFCFCASTMLSWLLYLCSIVWNQEGWFLQCHFIFSRLLWLFRVFYVSIQIVKKFYSSSVKNATGNLIGITVNLWVAMGSINIFTICYFKFKNRYISPSVLSLITFISVF